MPSGSLREKAPGKWEIRLDLPRGPDGKRRVKSVTFTGAKRAAQARLRELLREIDQGRHVEPHRLTVAEYLERWLTDYAAVTVTPKVLYNYRGVVEKHLYPTLGGTALAALAPAAIQALYRAKTAEVSAARVQLLHCVLRQALARAVKMRLLAWNPADAAEVPRHVKAELRVPGAGELCRILAAARGHWLYPGVLIATYTGARLGEVCALLWRDVDFAARRVTIRRALAYTPATGLVFKETKGGDIRVLAMTEELRAGLVQQKREQAERRLRFADIYQEHDLVWPWEDGRPRPPNNVSRAFTRFLEREGLPAVRFHSLRHAMASILLDAGESIKVVQHQLGHKTSRVTLDTYSHLIPGGEERAAAVFAECLRRAGG